MASDPFTRVVANVATDKKGGVLVRVLQFARGDDEARRAAGRHRGDVWDCTCDIVMFPLTAGFQPNVPWRVAPADASACFTEAGAACAPAQATSFDERTRFVPIAARRATAGGDLELAFFQPCATLAAARADTPWPAECRRTALGVVETGEWADVPTRGCEGEEREEERAFDLAAQSEPMRARKHREDAV